MYQPRNGFFASFENVDDEQFGFGLHLAYIVQEQTIIFGVQLLSWQFNVGYDFTLID